VQTTATSRLEAARTIGYYLGGEGRKGIDSAKIGTTVTVYRGVGKLLFQALDAKRDLTAIRSL
jgi:hypothetical protein